MKDAIKKHEEFSKKLDANDEKVDAVIDFAKRLANNNHYASEKILEKAHDIDERYNKYIIQLEYCVDIDVLMD